MKALSLIHPMLNGLDPAQMPADAIEVGRIGDAWGVKGWFKVYAYSADPEAVFSSKRWFLLPAEKGQKTFEGCVRLSIMQAKPHSDVVVALAHDISDRNAAECLRGARVFISRASFPSTGVDEFYWVDLIGLEVMNRQGESMGIVRELLSTGPQTVLVLEFTQNGKPQERMIPFVSAFIDKVDIASRQIQVDWHADY